MSESGETSKPSIQQDSATESEEDDSDTDFDPEEIEKEIMGVRSVLRRQCAKHKVKINLTLVTVTSPIFIFQNSAQNHKKHGEAPRNKPNKLCRLFLGASC